MAQYNHIGSLKGPKGAKGDPGTFDAAVAKSVPADAPAKAIITGDRGQNLELEIPRGLPGTNAVANDEAFATYLGAEDTSTHAAGKALAEQAATAETSKRLALPVNAVGPKRSSMPGMFTLLGGTPDENMVITQKNNELDTCTRVTLPDGAFAWRLYKHGAGTSFYAWTPSTPIDVPPSQAFLLDVDISDATRLPVGDASRYIQVKIFTDEALTDANAVTLYLNGTAHTTVFHGMTWSGGPLKTGRNLIRCAADHPYGVPAAWGSKVYKVEIRIAPANSVTLDVRGLMLEAPKKARNIVIADRGYKPFYDYAYPKLRAAGIPVTWAVDPGLFGTGTGENVAMTEAELHAAMASGNGDSCSFHAWQGQATSGLTAEQLIEDTARCIKWLQRHGYEGRMWRAAFTQGNAPASAAIKDMVIGARNGDNRMGVARYHGTWPPIGWMHMTAQQLDNITLTSTAVVDQRFDLMKKTHGMFLPFFHAIGNTQFNITPAMFDYWLDKAKQAMADGWLEFGTFESFFAESGGSISSINGRPVATWTEIDGSVVSKPLM